MTRQEALKLAGIYPKGRKPPRLGPGDEVAFFEVPSRAVPWTPPRVSQGRHAFKDRRLVAWQQEVALRARLAMAGREPYPWPVAVALTFRLTRPTRRKPPDTDNMGKGTADALQGIVIVDDTQVDRIESIRFFGVADRVEVIVTAWGMEEED